MPRCHAAILAALLLLGLTLCANLPTAAYRTPSSWSRHTKDIACELLETGSSPRMVETYRASDRLTFKYDYMGRRVEKCVYSGDTLTSKTLYVYDGFKCVEELDGLAGNAVLRRHAWQPFDVGLDVILATTDAAGASYFLHDANKNVMQRTDAEGDLLEKYEYAPFGGNTGEARASVGFSSEAFDAATDLDYYNYRYYAPGLGRWTKRDMIEEHGGTNLYGFVSNGGCLYVDFLGMRRLKIFLDFENSNKYVVNRQSKSIAAGKANQEGFKRQGIVYIGGKEDQQDSFPKTIAEGIERIRTAVGPYHPDGLGECNCIEHIYIAQHGREKNIYIGESEVPSARLDYLNETIRKKGREAWREDFSGTRKPIEFLEAVNGLLCSTGTTVEFVQCNVARDPAGADKILFFLAAYLPDAEEIILHTSVARLNGGVVSGDRMYGVGMNKQYK